LLVDAIVPDAHLNAAVAGIRGLGWAGLRVLAVGPNWTAAGLWSRQAVARAVSPSVIDDTPGYADRLGLLAAEHGPLVVYPSREETIDVMLDSASRWGDVMLPFPGGDVLGMVRDKGRLTSTAAGAGLETPDSWFEGMARELRSMTFSRPVVVKPARPVSRLKTAKLARDAVELAHMLDGVPDDEPLLVGKQRNLEFFVAAILPQAIALGKSIQSNDESALDPALFA